MPGRKTPHTATYKGMWVWVKLKNGEEFVDQFVYRTHGKRVIFREHTVNASQIDRFILRGRHVRAEHDKKQYGKS
jgi:hypothetical protein